MNSFSSLVRTGLLCFAVAAIPVATGCGMDVGVSSTSGTGGHAGGAGGGCSNGSNTGVGGAETTTGAGGAETTTGVGGGAFCGGIGGIQCGPTEYCDFPGNSCGFGDESGTCKPRPMACDANYLPTCGCNGQIYGNDCTANAAGQDVAPAGTCTPPVGTFACGAHFCDLQTDYCSRFISGVPGADPADSFSCQPVPQACGNTPTCNCLAGVACGDQCQPTSDGGLLVTCAAP